MKGPFEAATRAAIEEMIQIHSKESKFGYLLTHESAKELTDAVYQLILTSRTLKAAGDRMLSGGVSPIAPSSPSLPPTRKSPRPLPEGVALYKSRVKGP